MSLTRQQKATLLHFWPKILLPKTRTSFRNNIFRISAQERQREMKDGIESFVDPWAFIRVKNERRTLMASLQSILPVIHKGVIAYNYTEDEFSDGSDRIIEDFCKQHKGFIPFKYPYYVEPVGSAKYLDNNLPQENTLAGYYNATLAQIPKNEWLIKIDVDQIYAAEILKHSFSLPKNEKDVVMYSRLNVVQTSDGVKVIDYIRPFDHWLIYNKNLSFINVAKKVGSFKNNRILAYEQLKIGDKHNLPYLPECSTLHFLYEKAGRSYSGNINTLKSIRDFITSTPPVIFQMNF